MHLRMMMIAALMVVGSTAFEAADTPKAGKAAGTPKVGQTFKECATARR